MTFIGTIGGRAIARVRGVTHLFAVCAAVLREAVRPRRWPRTVRAVFARQLLFTGVEALPFVSLVALLAGVSAVVQAQVWLGRAGRSDLLGGVLIAVIVREVAPLLVNFIVIGRSGAAMAVELAGMKVLGEIRVMESQGLDPLLYIALPRVVATAVSVFCLTVWFTVVSFAGGYLFGVLLGAGAADPATFLDAVLKGLGPADACILTVKTLLPGLLTAGICVIEGLGVRRSITEAPQAATRAVVRSIAALFIVSAIVSVLTYL